MKKHLIILSLFIALLGLPLTLFAEDTLPLLTVNHLNYKAQYEPLLLNHTLYLCGQDFADITYGTYTQTADTATLCIQTTTFTYSLTDGHSTCNGSNYLPNARFQYINDSLVYFPITILDDCHYPYTYDNGSFSIEPLLPYSGATDQSKEHKKLETDYTSYDEIFAAFSSTQDIGALVADAKEDRSYLSLISLSHKADSYKLINDLLFKPPTTTVYFRHLDTSSNKPVLGAFDVYPMTYRFEENILTLRLNDEMLPCNCFWAAYDPYSLTTDIDINKSLDVMLMRTLYEYYRDNYQIKDDLTVSPILKVTHARSDSMCFDIYFSDDEAQTAYQLILYKQCNLGTVNFYIDLIPKN